MRAVIHDGISVRNVIEYDPDSDFAPDAGLTLTPVGDDVFVGPGFLVEGDGSFSAPPIQALLVDNPEILADGSDTATVTYQDTRKDAPSEVTFTANGATKVVSLTDQIASLPLTASSVGPIEVSVDVEGVPSVQITAKEVPAKVSI